MYSNMKYYENICNCLRVIQQDINRKLKSANCWQRTSLTHISLASFLWVIGKRIATDMTPQNAASHLGLFYLLNLFHRKMKTKMNQSRTNGPINAHLTIVQVMPKYNHNNEKQEALL